MSEFLTWHPSSDNGKAIYAIRSRLIDQIYRDPKKALDVLRREWKFGEVSELWDDFIFDNIIRAVLDQNQLDSLTAALSRYNTIDHHLFHAYIRREENPVRFRRSFWNVNAYGQRLSQRAVDFLDIPVFNNSSLSCFKSNLDLAEISSPKKIAFILKGPYHYAHVEFLHSFLQGSSVFSSKVALFLILLDDSKNKPKGIANVHVISLAKYTNPFDKLKAYYDYCLDSQFDHICWVACVQNLSLYMGAQMAPVQSYWSMKYHSIIMPTIQKYAGLGFGGKSFYFDDVEWFRGRAFPELSMPPCDNNLVTKSLKKCDIDNNAIVVGCFVRAEKLHDRSLWESISKIILHSKNIHFVVASQYIPTGLADFLKINLHSDAYRFHHLGWVNTKEWAYNLDIYYDSSPRGSCNTIFEVIEARIPVLMADTTHNRESSALPYLLSASQLQGFRGLPPGIFVDELERCNACLKLVDNKNLRLKIANQQTLLLKSLQGQKQLFAKDYLNFFLGSNMTLENTQSVI